MGVWFVETRVDYACCDLWSIHFQSESQEEARKFLDKLRNKVYYLHNGTIEYW